MRTLGKFVHPYIRVIFASQARLDLEQEGTKGSLRQELFKWNLSLSDKSANNTMEREKNKNYTLIITLF
jgi:hypothetical protein